MNIGGAPIGFPPSNLTPVGTTANWLLRRVEREARDAQSKIDADLPF